MAADADLDLGVDADGPVMRSFIEQASPFADVLDDALIERETVPDVRTSSRASTSSRPAAPSRWPPAPATS